MVMIDRNKNSDNNNDNKVNKRIDDNDKKIIVMSVTNEQTNK